MFVPAIVLAALAIWALIYKLTTGKPFIVVHSGRNDAPAPDAESEIVDVVTPQSMEGLWRMISVGRNGNFAPPEVIERGNVAIAVVGNTITDTATLELSTFQLNNDVIPNQLDQTDQNGDTHLCIVRMRGGHLEICQGEVGKPRPTNFDRRRHDGASLTLFELVISADELEKESGE